MHIPTHPPLVFYPPQIPHPSFFFLFGAIHYFWSLCTPLVESCAAFVTKVKGKMYMGQKKDWKQWVLAKKTKIEETKRELCSAHPKGFGQQQVLVGAFGVHLSIFLHLVSTFSCIYSFKFSNLDLCSWIIIQFCITTFQRIPLTYYPTKLHLQAPWVVAPSLLLQSLFHYRL